LEFFVRYFFKGRSTAKLSDKLFHHTDTRLAGVIRNQHFQDWNSERKLFGSKTVFLKLLRNNPYICDTDFFLYGVTSKVNKLHTIQKHFWNFSHVVCRSNEENL